MPDDASFLRRNAFLIAAVALPGVVIALFVAATLVSRSTVAPPAYDLIFAVMRPWDDGARTRVFDFVVRDGRVHATVRIAPQYSQGWALLRFDHESMDVSEIPLDLPEDLGDNESRTVPVEALADTRVLDSDTAPDGYRIDTRSDRPGIVGELFGMNGYRRQVTLVNRGRAVTLEMPEEHRNVYASSVQTVGWVADGGR